MKNQKIAVLLLVLTYIIWGTQSLYWNIFEGIPLNYIMAHRIAWSVVFVFPVLFVMKKQGDLIAHFKNPKALMVSSFAGIMIGLNWAFNVYAVSSRQIIEASLGHYISPVLILFIGAVIFREEIPGHKKLAIALTVVAMFNVILLTGRIPLLTIGIISTFVLYTYVKKINSGDVIVAFIAELIVIAPFAAGYLLYMNFHGVPLFYHDDCQSILLLISTGAYTGYVLLIFSYGVKGIDFTNLGFVQYLAPTISLMLGVFFFNESFTRAHLYSFPLIWLSVMMVVFFSVLKIRKKESVPLDSGSPRPPDQKRNLV